MLTRYLPRFQQAQRAQGELARRETLSRTEIQAFQLEKLNALWASSIRFVPYYRELATQKRLPRQFDSIESYFRLVPLLTKSQLKEHPQSFLSESKEPGGWHRSSGSTGEPLAVYWSYISHREMLWTKYRFYSLWGVELFDPVAFLWSPAVASARSFADHWKLSRQRLEDRLRNRLRISAYHLSEEDLREDLRQIARFKPAAIYGFSQAAYQLARIAAEDRFECPSLKVCILTSEPLYSRMSDAITEAFRVPTAIEYGATGCGLIAFQHPDGGLQVREDLVMLETLPRDDGRYDIVFSVLTNPSFPLLRYAIGDITDAPLRFPDRGFASLGNIEGRNDDYVLTRTGRMMHPSRLDRVFEGPSCDSVRKFQIQQALSGALCVDIIADRNADVGMIKREFVELMEGYPVTVRIVESIPLNRGGKHRAISSQLAGHHDSRPLQAPEKTRT